MKILQSGLNDPWRRPTRERGSRPLHLVDRFLGIPLVFLLGAIRRRRTVPSGFSPKRVGLLQLAAIGDTVLLSGATRDIRAAWPMADITLFASSTNEEIAHMLHGVNRVVTLPVRHPLVGVRKIRNIGRFDVWLDFGPWPRLNALYSLASRASCTVGFASRRQFRHYGYDIVVPHRDSIHELQNYRSLLMAVGVESTSDPVLPVNGIESSHLLSQFDGPFAVVHMFPGGVRPHMKEWGEERWLDVCRFLLSQGIGILFTGGPSDYNRANKVKEALPSQKSVVNGAGIMKLEEVTTALGHASVVISVNTGVMHMAAAVNAPLVAIHGPTSPKRWGPVSSTASTITPKGLSCSPCLHLGFDYQCQLPHCMLSIPTKDVLRTINNILEMQKLAVLR